MKRNEYRLLVENWNSYLVKEEKRMLSEKLLIESFLLNEISLTNLVNGLKTSLPILTIALASLTANVSTAKVVDGSVSGLSPKMQKVVDSAVGKIKGDEEAVAEKAKDIQGTLKGISQDDRNVLVAQIVEKVGQGSDEFESRGFTSGKVISRTITPEEKEVIKLLKLYDSDEDSFLEAIKSHKNKSLLCSFGYCFSQWKKGNENEYHLVSPLGHRFTTKKNVSGIDPIPKGKAVEIHEMLSNVPKDDYVKVLRKRYQKLSSKKDKRLRKWGQAVNEILLTYQNAWMTAQNAKVKSASETFPGLIQKLEKNEEFDLVDQYHKCVENNEEAFFEALRESYIESINSLVTSGVIGATAGGNLIKGLKVATGYEDYSDFYAKMEKAALLKIYGTSDFAEIYDMYNLK